MYTALYRRWRPLTFDDVVSQPHITTTLKNQIINNKTAHAYLFTGSRGTGKTTCARIFAKAINCEHSSDGAPCLECDICRDADDFALADIIEIDAASNNGVEDIRDLRDGAVFTPERCKYKVYIIDEVHMLSVNAFNALLKIMEEPPSYVKFILATTEIHKVPATIASRCQRYDFKRIVADDIAKRLLYIASQEKILLDDDAAFLIAKLADGGMRDALSLLDQCMAFSENIDTRTVSTAAGIAGRDQVFGIIGSILDKKPEKGIAYIDELYSGSKDMARLCEEIIFQFRNIMLIKIDPGQTSLLSCMPDEIEILKELAQKTDLQTVMSYLTDMQECSEKMIRAINKRVELEMCIIRLASGMSAKTASVPADLSSRLDEMEKMISRAVSGKSVPATSATRTATAEYNRPDEPQVDFSKLNQKDFRPVPNWAEVLEKFSETNPAVSASLTDSKAFVNGNGLFIIANNPFFITLFRNKEHAAMLGDAIESVLGKRYAIRAKCNAEATKEEKNAIKLIEKAKSSEIETSLE
ncbi:MAG: DNA polymerase III subunit gamma/tau [Oscillospiraceae bacterium]|nr:DNA polymerase III subunit gamma/tau [Oscillospiraceae bacterium]